MRQGFGLNTNLFETNVLNLRVVFRVVVTVVGDAFRSTLDSRRETILATLRNADQKATEAQRRLDEARKAVERATSRSEEIRTQAIKTAEQERFIVQEKLKEDLQRVRDRGKQNLLMERQRVIRSFLQQVAISAINTAENTLLKELGTGGTTNVKQKELNAVHVRETFRKLKGLSF